MSIIDRLMSIENRPERVVSQTFRYYGYLISTSDRSLDSPSHEVVRILDNRNYYEIRHVASIWIPKPDLEEQFNYLWALDIYGSENMARVIPVIRFLAREYEANWYFQVVGDHANLAAR
jgi:hypothetical protein